MIKKIFLLSLFLLIGFVSFYVFKVIRYHHSSDWNLHKEYFWIFKHRQMEDLVVGHSWIGVDDIYNSFTFKDKTVVTVWEFKNFDNLNLKDITIGKTAVDLSSVKVAFHEILNTHSNPNITIKYGYDFNNTLTISLDPSSEIIKTINSNNYKGFYGLISGMSFSDNADEHLILFKYPEGKIPLLFLVYKKAEKFFVIMVKYSNPLDETSVKQFNLF